MHQLDSNDEKVGPSSALPLCCRYSYLTKVEPTERALQMLKPHAWITGRRRSQGYLREKLQLVEKDAGNLGRKLESKTSHEIMASLNDKSVFPWMTKMKA